MATQQIVVCDDEPHIVRAISLKLTRAGFDVKGVADVESCWRLLQRDTQSALLILDSSISPGSASEELVRRLRGDHRFVDLPVIMLAPHRSDLDESAQWFAELKMVQIICKPFSPRELLVNVNRLLGQESGPHIATYGRNYRASDCKL